MVYLIIVFTLLLMFSSDEGKLPPFTGLNHTNKAMKSVFRRETPLLPPPFLQLPMFVDSRLPLVEKGHFSPARGTGLEPLPETVREILLSPVRPKSIRHRTSGFSVTTSCQREKMFVQVEKGILGTGESQTQAKLGTCKPSKSTKDYIYYEYGLDMCGTKQTIHNNQVAFSNIVHYDPPKFNGPIRRAVPFTIPVSCYYNRYQYSYKIGFKPKMRMRKIFKPMKNRVKFILTPRNAQWERLLPSDQYVLGKLMYFEVEAPSMPQNQRLYAHLCYATPEKSINSTPQFQVVKNFGCMAESKDRRSRFFPYKSNIVRFSVDAFLFKGMTGQQLFMHCNMSVGSSIPTVTAKSCNYDAKAKRWVELYGPDSVCSCCDSTCSSAASKETKIVSSKPWTIKHKVKPTTAPKRKKGSTTAAITAAAAATTTTTTTMPSPESTKEVKDQMTTLQPEKKMVTVAGKVANAVKELKWPFGGQGVHWVEFEEEEKQVNGAAIFIVDEEEEEEGVKQVKGSAAVVVEEMGKEDEEEEEEGVKQVKGSAAVVVDEMGKEDEEEEEDGKVVTQPRTIFEEIFGFDK